MVLGVIDVVRPWSLIYPPSIQLLSLSCRHDPYLGAEAAASPARAYRPSPPPVPISAAETRSTVQLIRSMIR